MKKKTARMDDEEKIAILEGIARDPETSASARVTAIRTLREYWPQEPAGAFEDLVGDVRPFRVKRG